MTIDKINEVLNEMRTIYPFDDKETYIQLGNLISGQRSDLVEITTKDKKTGITITMSKHLADSLFDKER